ncbi:ADP-ribosylation factor GTPase-activating protein AGD4-like [Heracleum sosnowskyi]|uniref:ADP-ribosylation factor GTPase-activating protein AGD4-like n=1 Tax=Heracleum sosnowskyi TaxID=360622 RepID=A0AAD8IR60_9APIA|nr:ADP-ribosylation factor GTPase-activating protein AGD4-like [Heracleum sosnowskyi]
MSSFIKLDDSPMFQKQMRSLERTTDDLKDRCQRLYKGCRKYMEVLSEACNGDTIFAEALEAFGGGQDDLISVSIGGPVISKFITSFRELATFKELLRSQVEHVLVDRLAEFLSVDLQNAKDSRRRLDKASHSYDQAREKFTYLKKNAREEVVAELEEDLQNSKSAFERSRFNLVSSLMNIESKKKYEFLESLSAIMDAHLRYFKLGHDLFNQMEPFIHQVLTYAQQSKEHATVEQDKLAKRIQEFRTQAEMDQLRASSNIGASTTGVVINGVGMNSDKNIEAIMQSTATGRVQTIKQGYLLKRSSSLRADWKRRFFILDSHGELYYHRQNETRPAGSPSYQSLGSLEHHGRVFGRFRTKHQRSSSNGEESLGLRTVDLRTSTIKLDADDTDLRLCFRIISPSKTHTLLAETEADRIDWVNKIQGVIASLLNSQLRQLKSGGNEYNKTSSGSHYESGDQNLNRADNVSRILREIPGNEICAECGAPEPDWASLNLGVLMCIECSGVHRNLGVHRSKVRSINLDVKVWEPTMLDLFRTLGNAFCNSIWENLLQEDRTNGSNADIPLKKPNPEDGIQQKDKYIRAKYGEKLLVKKEATVSGISFAVRIWGAVSTNKLQEVYHLIVTSDSNIINTTYDEVAGTNSSHYLLDHDRQKDYHDKEKEEYDPTNRQTHEKSNESGEGLQGCTLLHVACSSGNFVMVELLLQFGADINRSDHRGRTPLHHCICSGNNELAKFLLRRGARASIKDDGGLGALERAMEMGAISDEELFVLLSESM